MKARTTLSQGDRLKRPPKEHSQQKQDLEKLQSILYMEIKKALKETDSSMAEFAQKMGLSRSALRRLLNPSTITLEDIQKIGDALGRRLHLTFS